MNNLKIALIDDLLFPFIIWLILIFAFIGILKLFKREKFTSRDFKTLFSVVCVIILISLSVKFMTGKYDNIFKKDFTIEDEKILKDIVQTSFFSNQELTKDTHTQFYSIIDKYELKQDDIDTLLNTDNFDKRRVYLKLFYEDALVTLNRNCVYLSEERKNIENKIMTEPEKEENYKLMVLIRDRKRFYANNDSILFDSTKCIQGLKNLEYTINLGKANIEKLKNKYAFQ